MNTPKKTVLESAKQGNLKAVSILINKSLSSHGIFVSDIQIIDGLLTIKLKSKTGDVSETAIAKIKVGAEKLDIKSVERIEVTNDSQELEIHRPFIGRTPSKQ